LKQSISAVYLDQQPVPLLLRGGEIIPLNVFYSFLKKNIKFGKIVAMIFWTEERERQNRNAAL
jgi:hypothetical protein